jgi:hypothetical protein
MNEWDAKFDFTLLQNWPAIRKDLMTALKWTGWDRQCGCHACDLVRGIRKKLWESGGVDIEELT